MWKVSLLGLFFIGIAGIALATDPPDLINYQGVLRDPNNVPYSGTFAMTFRFFSGLTGGDEILVDAHDDPNHLVSVTGGLFSVHLGGGTLTDGAGPGDYGSLAAVFRDYSQVYLEVEVSAEVLTPRVQVVSAASSLNSQFVRGRDLVSTGPLDLFVDAATGDDTKDCLSAPAACETIQAAIDRIPPVLGGNVTVHIASGTYSGGISLLSRSSPSSELYGITLVGEPQATITGSGVQESGIQLAWVTVRLENLTIREFTQEGLSFFETYASVDSCIIEDNSGWGVVVHGSFDMGIGNTTIRGNGNIGLECQSSSLNIGASQQPGEEVEISNNEYGIYARMNCAVGFEGKAAITGNTQEGIKAMQGYIDLKDRSDVQVDQNNGCSGRQMYSVAHGTIAGYQNVPTPCSTLCQADSISNAVCYPWRI